MPLRLPAKGGKPTSQRFTAGTHMAVCTMVADVGLQPGGNSRSCRHQGQGWRSQILAACRARKSASSGFEIPSERIAYVKDGVEKEGPAVIYHNLHVHR